MFNTGKKIKWKYMSVFEKQYAQCMYEINNDVVK